MESIQNGPCSVPRRLANMKLAPSKFRQFLRAMVLIHVSLIAAFTVRFLIMIFFERVGTGSSYWQFVHYTLVGYRNSVIPILLVGACVVDAHERWMHRIVRASSYWISLASITFFYGLMVLIGVSLSRGISFPRQTWGLAWVFSLVIFTALTLVGRIDEGARERLIYNRVWHFVIDCSVLALAYFLSYIFRFDGFPPPLYQRQFFLLLPYVILLYVGMNLVWQVYAFVWRFTTLKEAIVLALSITSSGLILLLTRILLLERYPSLQVPFGVLLAQPSLTYIGLVGVRLLRRIQYNYLIREKIGDLGPASKKRVLLVGAGRAGMMMVRELESHRNYKIVGFLDDDRSKQGRVINGIHVLGNTHAASAIIKEHEVREVIFCMPSAPRAVIRRVTASCSEFGISALSVPSLSEILLSKVKIGRLRPVKMEDLLGRASIEFPSDDHELISAYSSVRILITGAAGSIGSELVRQLKDFNPTQLILLDKDENGLYEIGLEVREEFKGEITEIVADVRDRDRLERVFRKWKPEAVFHAAAYKHVPMMEYHPSEAVLNNILGTKNVVDLASDYGARSFLLISTDKAVNPTSVMGASKRVAEMVVRYRALHSKTATRFCCVRFGNVLGSRASVVPLFQKRIAEGKNIQVTHPDIVRYFMTIPEAVQLVIQAGSLGRQGETFVLDMGDAVKIADLARDLIEQSGLIPGKDIEIEFTGLRPGEKLFEELLLTEESGARSTKYSKIFVDKAIQYDWALLEKALKILEEAARSEDLERIYQAFKSLDIGYQRKIVSLPAASGR